MRANAICTRLLPRAVGLLLLSTLAAAPCGAAEAGDSALPTLGKAHLWFSYGGVSLSGDAEDLWGLQNETYAGLAFYGHAGGGWYFGGELTLIANDQTVDRDGVELRDVALLSAEFNTKHSWNLGQGFAIAAGFGSSLFVVDGNPVGYDGFEDFWTDFGFGLVAFGELDWRWRRLVVGASVKYHLAADVFDVNYSGFRWGAHVVVVF
jgi:hypothetical protein